MSKDTNDASVTGRRSVLKALSMSPILAAMSEAAIADEPAPPAEDIFVKHGFDEPEGPPP